MRGQYGGERLEGGHAATVVNSLGMLVDVGANDGDVDELRKLSKTELGKGALEGIC